MPRPTTAEIATCLEEIRNDSRFSPIQSHASRRIIRIAWSIGNLTVRIRDAIVSEAKTTAWNRMGGRAEADKFDGLGSTGVHE